MDSPDVIGCIIVVTCIGAPNKKSTMNVTERRKHLALYHIYK